MWHSVEERNSNDFLKQLMCYDSSKLAFVWSWWYSNVPKYIFQKSTSTESVTISQICVRIRLCYECLSHVVDLLISLRIEPLAIVSPDQKCKHWSLLHCFFLFWSSNRLKFDMNRNMCTKKLAMNIPVMPLTIIYLMLIHAALDTSVLTAGLDGLVENQFPSQTTGPISFPRCS